jgi:hypothetical protein
MIDEFREILSALDNPAMKHAIFGHLPIALCVLLVPLTLTAAILRSNRTCRIIALCGFALLGVMAFLTVNTGEHAEAAIDKVLNPQVYELLEKHEEMAEKLWFFAVAGVILMAASDRISRPGIRALALWLAVVSAIASVGWVSITAHQGGTLVYRHGVGTPNPVACEDLKDTEHQSNQQADGESSDDRIAFFHKTVFPILSENCFQCHNPAKAAARKSGRLDLTTQESLVKGGASGSPINPGNPDQSLLIQKVRHADPEEVMPPDDPLTPEQIAALEQWIRDGAAWQ